MPDVGAQFEITDVDVRGVRTPVFTQAPQSLRAIWESSAVHGNKPYLVYGDERLTFADAHRRVTAIANELVASYGVRPGERVAIAVRNYPEWALAFWAATCVGAVVVPLNAWWTGPELAYGLRDSGSVLLFADDERIERLMTQSHDGSALHTVVLIRADPLLDRVADSGIAATQVVRFDDVVAAGSTVGAPTTLPDLEIDTDSDATIMYTSGTTGKPKGAVATHRNFGAFLMNLLYRGAVAAAASPSPPASSPKPAATLLTFPFFHVGGLQSFLMMYTALGGKIVLMYKWNADEAVDLIEREEVTAVAGVPTTVFQLLETAAARGIALSSLTGVSAGATLVPPELVRRIDTQLLSRAAPTNGYGLTETSGAAITNSGRDYVAKPDSVGRPVSPVMGVRIADPDGNALPTGAVGEIWLSGPTIVRGYFNNDEATAASFTDGWFHTGDLGRLDDEGYLYVVDRLKDVVIRGGENIYAAEVEAALYEHPDIIEAAIVGLPHDTLGEEVAAVVRVRDGVSLSVDDVRAHVASRLASFKVPTRVWIGTDELPRNGTGKVLKRELRDSLAAAIAP